MTAREMAALLSTLPADLQVVVRDGHCCGQGGSAEDAWWNGTPAVVEVVPTKGYDSQRYEDPCPRYEGKDTRERVRVVAIS